jgi:type I restriction enzyme M protein
MLDNGTKRRIDTARDILVGKVPDPKSQVEQITIALIYKFMDDMDIESEELGGKRKFFTKDFARYRWANLVRSGMGGHETLNLYAEGIAKMPENPGIPPLFREIFKNAYLPYRDPETLRAFLKIIDEFTYDHSEKLGDAFEYLLSVMSSQGDAGQFRTPRHIIDFIVKVVDPKKNETVLDPACGTAGFLISSYKHIRKCNTDAEGNNKLTPDERKRLAQNFKGYDISPDMVRLSLVNMYLHGFTDPHIYEYDTLTSQERWNDYADVILANPPFMSPKGGIKPHNRFSVQSKRSEVLFVDYMAEHLTPAGRAGIIVPEGIIFQSGTAYKQLRKMLVDDYLVAVVSMPAGMFNPYSGVKTSILILDKSLAKKTNTIGFFKVENDGFGLGAQRRSIDKDDLPQACVEIAEYLHHVRTGKSLDDFKPTLGLIVKKEKIEENGDYNLSGERYREGLVRTTAFPHACLNTIAEITAGNAAPQGEEYFKDGVFPFIRTSDVGAVHLTDNFIGTSDKLNQKAIDEFRLRMFPTGTILFPKSGASTFLNHRVVMGKPAYVSSHLACIICDETKTLPKYVYSLLCRVDARQITPDQAYPSLRLTEIGNIQIPLPPLEVQKEIVAEIEGYQKVIDGARVVVDNYRPHIPIDPSWTLVKLGDLVDINNGFGLSEFSEQKNIACIKVSDMNLMENQIEIITSSHWLENTDKRLVPVDSIVFPKRGAAIATNKKRITRIPCLIDNNCMALTVKSSATLHPRFLFNFLIGFDISSISNSAGIALINNGDINGVEIPLPPLETQQAIVAEIEAEQVLINANHELITRMEKKIQTTLTRVWGEESEEEGSGE